MSDSISRQAAIDVLSLGKEILSRVLDDMDIVGTDREKYLWGLELIESSIEDIKELPPAQPRMKGKWIPHKEISREYIGATLASINYDYMFCDNCGYKITEEQMYNYCPNCGCKMEEARKKSDEVTE